jgi:phospholipid transport system substrate-binding protein
MRIYQLNVFLMALGLVALCLFATHGRAMAETEPAAAFIRSLGDRALDILQTPGSKKVERREKFRSLFSTGFDLETIGKFVLGRYWQTATPEQRDEYLVLFPEFIVDTYAARFDSYAGETFDIVQVVPIDARDSIVNTNIYSADGTPFRVDYRVRKSDNEFKIVDVLVEGVSLLVTHRSEIASVVNREGMNGLLAKLREQTGTP